MSERIFRDITNKGHRITRREWNERSRELNRLRTVQGVRGSGTIVKHRAGGVFINNKGSGNGTTSFCAKYTADGWRECDALTGILIPESTPIANEYVGVVGALDMTYPLSSSDPSTYSYVEGDYIDKRTQAVLVILGENKYAAIIDDFYQQCLVKCTNATYRGFEEINQTGESVIGGRTFTGVKILGDFDDEWELSAEPTEETLGLHTLVPDENQNAWVDGVILIVQPNYAYYYE